MVLSKGLYILKFIVLAIYFLSGLYVIRLQQPREINQSHLKKLNQLLKPLLFCLIFSSTIIPLRHKPLFSSESFFCKRKNFGQLHLTYNVMWFYWLSFNATIFLLFFAYLLFIFVSGQSLKQISKRVGGLFRYTNFPERFVEKPEVKENPAEMMTKAVQVSNITVLHLFHY